MHWLITVGYGHLLSQRKARAFPQSIASHHRGNISSLIGLKFQGSTQIIQTSITSDIWLGWRHSYSTSEAKIGTKFADASPKRFLPELTVSKKIPWKALLRVSLGTKDWRLRRTWKLGELLPGKARNIGANLFIGKKF